MGLGLTPQAADGRAVVKGDDWSFGYNLGIVWAPDGRWRLGVTYRSEIAHKLEGDADFTVPASASLLTASGLFADTGASARLDLPASLEAGVMWRASDRTTLYASVRERYWSSLREIRVKFDNPLQPDAVEEANYKDATRYAVGVDYKLSDQWVLHAGFAVDETPTNEAHRLARIADDTRRYYAIGASWTGSEDWRLDIGYNWVEIADNEFDHVGDFGERLRGKFEGAAHVLSIGVTRSFGTPK